MAGRHLAAEGGKGWSTGAPPYGYRLDEDGYLAIQESEAEIVLVMFEMRSTGMPYRAIADHLNERGIEPRHRNNRQTGKRILQGFSAGSVHAYLHAAYYKGEPIERSISPAFGAEPSLFEFPVPAIISEGLWESSRK
jgi:hypothetical protein